MPYAIVAGLAFAVFGSLLVIGLGSGGGGAEASYPEGYTPPTLGDPSAPVEMVIWADFQCPFCRRFDLTTLEALKAEYFDTGKAKLVWRNFVNYGNESEDAAIAAHCAGEQGKFWEYHAVLYQNQSGINSGAFSPANLKGFASTVGLDAGAFDACTQARSYAPVIAADKSTGQGDGVSATPTFFIDGELVVGAQPTETFAAYLDNAIARARP